MNSSQQVNIFLSKNNQIFQNSTFRSSKKHEACFSYLKTRNKNVDQDENKEDQEYSEGQNSFKWTNDELKILFVLYNEHKSQWALIHQSISTKTKVQIRNRFYGTLRKLIRNAMEFFNVSIRCLSKISNKMKPSILQKIYHSEKEFQFMNGAIMSILFQMKFRIDRDALKVQFKKNFKVYQNMIQLVAPDKKKSKLNYQLFHHPAQVEQHLSLLASNHCLIPEQVTIPKETENQYFVYPQGVEFSYFFIENQHPNLILSSWKPVIFYY